LGRPGLYVSTEPEDALAARFHDDRLGKVRVSGSVHMYRLWVSKAEYGGHVRSVQKVVCREGG
jgi:hypothetical protein